MMNYKMIVLDLDGTLTDKNKKITDKTKKVLIEAQKQGKVVVLASGRPTSGVMPLAKELDLQEYGGCILSFNGGMVIDCKTENVIFSSQLPVEANERIIQLAKKHQVNILTYEKELVLSPDIEDRYVKVESEINQLTLKQVENFEQYVNFPVVKFLMVGDGDYLAKVEVEVKEALGEGFSVYRSEPFFLEILPKGIDKAQSLARMLESYGIKREEVIACGDGYNDLSMIQFAGLGVAMANAVQPLKDIADYQTFSNDQDGVAHVVEKFLLS